MKVGITGHQDREGIDWSWTERSLERELRRFAGPLEGFSSLAAGTDQLFAKLVLKCGGRLIAVIPKSDYIKHFAGESLRDYVTLRSKATQVEELLIDDSDEIAFLKAGQHIVDLTECLFAVWDGKPAKGLGGTADIVQYAAQIQKLIIHLDPIKRRVRRLNKGGV